MLYNYSTELPPKVIRHPDKSRNNSCFKGCVNDIRICDEYIKLPNAKTFSLSGGS